MRIESEMDGVELTNDFVPSGFTLRESLEIKLALTSENCLTALNGNKHPRRSA